MNKPKQTELVKQVYKQLLAKKRFSSYEVAKQTGIDKAYLSKLASGAIKKPGQDKLTKIARVLDVELKQLEKIFTQPQVAAVELALGKINLSQLPVAVNPCQDWGNAPDGLVCHGRQEEIKQLKQWAISDNSRVITLFGLNGIGKTTVGVKVTQQLQRDFDYIFWRSLRSAPSMEITIDAMLRLFSRKKVVESSLNEKKSRLFTYLRTFRCLIVFDDVESILASNSLEQYHADYQSYGEFVRQMAESQHKSCLFLVSQEKLREMAIRESNSALVHSLQLMGLDATARKILQDKELSEEEKWNDLIEAYHGHPLALKIVASTIKEVFNDNLCDFLRQKTLFIGDFAFILHREYQKLSDKEQKVILAISDSDSSISISQLQKKLDDKVNNSDVLWSLDVLKRRSLIKIDRVKTIPSYTLHPVVKQYLANLD